MNPKVAKPLIDTHVILRDGDKLLFSQRGGPYGYGRWHLPSGKLDQGSPCAWAPHGSCAKRPGSPSTRTICA